MKLSRYSIFLAYAIPLVSAICYFPDGKSIPRQDTPCRSEGFSTCCGQGYACLSNNLCMLTEHVPNPIPGQSRYVRGSCTDQSWDSPHCPNFCIVPAHDDNFSGGTGVAKCDVTQDRYYCLDNQTEPLASSDICSSSTYFFEVAGTPSTVTIIGVTQTTSTLASTTLAISRSIKQSTSASNASPPSTSLTSKPLLTDLRPPPTSGTNYSTSIGAGVGVPLGVLTISIIALLIFRRRRYHRNVGADPPEYVEPPHSYYETKPDAPNAWGSERPVQGTVYHEAEWVQLVPQELPADDSRRT
ncbi:hypothetical protein T440DRAFT_407179 [Plenodomus tracheiphilus IPT5]|uniref:Mid2 domain-containing protein n=1 Tax=Plenodomus tracheiphilus IPT5 TaxID=1408161 RepID=A0A6A7ASM7_9PLEO|nr:hypothetical protein T440DRAFT_407179 [Plenodomus tracheiphilus IPT5]